MSLGTQISICNTVLSMVDQTYMICILPLALSQFFCAICISHVFGTSQFPTFKYLI